MPKKIFVLILCGILSLSAWGKDLSIMVWNVQNYLSCDRMVDGVWRRGYPKPEGEKAVLFDTVGEYKPDIFAVCELGGKEYFDEFRARLAAEGLNYPYAAQMHGDDPSRYLAIFSSIPFDLYPHPSISFRYGGKTGYVLRGLLEARFALDGQQPWRFYLVHLKSRSGQHPEDPESIIFRTGEAQAIRNLIDKEFDGVDDPIYLVAGDFNDSVRSRALKRFLKKGKTTRAVPLVAMDSRGECWTQYWAAEGVYSQLDHVLGTPKMLAWVKQCNVVDDENILKASDHRPVLIKIEVPEFTPVDQSK